MSIVGFLALFVVCYLLMMVVTESAVSWALDLKDTPNEKSFSLCLIWPYAWVVFILPRIRQNIKDAVRDAKEIG